MRFKVSPMLDNHCELLYNKQRKELIVTDKLQILLSAGCGVILLAMLTGQAPSILLGANDQSTDTVTGADGGISNATAIWTDALKMDGYDYGFFEQRIRFTDEYGDVGVINPDDGSIIYVVIPDFVINDSAVDQFNADDPCLYWSLENGGKYLCAATQLNSVTDEELMAGAIRDASMVFFARTHPDDPRSKAIIDAEEQSQ